MNIWFTDPNMKLSMTWFMSSAGVITFANKISDIVGKVQKDTLVISAESDNYQKKYRFVVVDGYDYFIQTHPEYKVINRKMEHLIFRITPTLPSIVFFMQVKQ